MWGQILSAATIFGVIVAVGAWVNGRRTTRIISGLIKEESKATRELIKEGNEGIRELLSIQTKILERIEAKLP